MMNFLIGAAILGTTYYYFVAPSGIPLPEPARFNSNFDVRVTYDDVKHKSRTQVHPDLFYGRDKNGEPMSMLCKVRETGEAHVQEVLVVQIWRDKSSPFYDLRPLILRKSLGHIDIVTKGLPTTGVDTLTDEASRQTKRFRNSPFFVIQRDHRGREVGKTLEYKFDDETTFSAAVIDDKARGSLRITYSDFTEYECESIRQELAMADYLWGHMIASEPIQTSGRDMWKPQPDFVLKHKNNLYKNLVFEVSFDARRPEFLIKVRESSKKSFGQIFASFN